MRSIFLSCLLIFSVSAFAQFKPFRFAFISDTHIGSPDGHAEEDLRRTVRDINAMNDIAFVVITGDITELGMDKQIVLAKQILDSLKPKYYIIPGNHDATWSESGGLSFSKVFGDDKLRFDYAGIHFIGCASGPYVRMSDGHVPRNAVNWMTTQLGKIKGYEPVIFLNHYPLDNGLDNWYEVIDLLKTKNTVLALCGHGHSNRPVQAEDIPAVMGRSNLRAKAAEGGYNLVDVRSDSILFTERKPVSGAMKQWTRVAFQQQHYDLNKKYPRPDFSINQKYGQVHASWTYASAANVISTPLVVNGLVVFGNQSGTVEALQLKDGKPVWTFQTGGPIYSSPATSNGRIVFGCTDGFVYCIDQKGKLVWKVKTKHAVLGAPVIEQGTVYIGGDSSFYALDLGKGTNKWTFDSLQGTVVSWPVINKDMLLFGAWDRNLYALNKNNGTLLWKWNNSSSVINFSPAACVPVVKDDVVYVVAPDRYLSAIDRSSGKTLWRTNEATVRESMGISNDGKLIYGKTMQDTIVAFYTNREAPKLAWKYNAGYGYEHTPSVLIENNNQLFFGTRSGVVYAIDPQKQITLWAHKIDNSMVNTLNVISDKKIIASTMDGKVCLLMVD